MASDKRPEVGNFDEQGRFAAGNQLSPLRGRRGGAAARRMAVMGATVARASKPEHVAALMTRLYQLGMAGDVAAARVYLDRACGKVRDLDGGAAPSALPSPAALVVAFIDQVPGRLPVVDGVAVAAPPLPPPVPVAGPGPGGSDNGDG